MCRLVLLEDASERKPPPLLQHMGEAIDHYYRDYLRLMNLELAS
jgi:hypothetical protein